MQEGILAKYGFPQMNHRVTDSTTDEIQIPDFIAAMQCVGGFAIRTVRMQHHCQINGMTIGIFTSFIGDKFFMKAEIAKILKIMRYF